jgi:hypothetical protein
VNQDDRIADGKAAVEAHAADPDAEPLRTLVWPRLDPAALFGTAGEIVKSVAPHTEADSAALLVQLLAVFGCTVGAGPHVWVANAQQRALLHPLIVGRTSDGAKGTALSVVEAVRRRALPDFDAQTTSGLSSAEGLIEAVRDGTADEDPGIEDKRLLVKESEYRIVLTRARREGNTLGPVLRQAWDGDTLRTLSRSSNRLTATDAHIVVVGHITPREFTNTVSGADISGGSVNRLLICLSKRARLHPRFGNIPRDVLDSAAQMFSAAHSAAWGRDRVDFDDTFWPAWERAYRELNRDRPESDATDATARGVPQVLRLSLLYALMDTAKMITAQHLGAAQALWRYCEASAVWLFSSYDAETLRAASTGLTEFIRKAGSEGRTRTDISRGFFKGHASSDEISRQLSEVVHNGVVVLLEEETNGRPRTRYVHRSCGKGELAKEAGQDHHSGAEEPRIIANSAGTDLDDVDLNARNFAHSSQPETGSDLQGSLNPLIRTCERCPSELLLPDNDTGLCAECEFIARQDAVACQLSRLGGEAS